MKKYNKKLYIKISVSLILIFIVFFLFFIITSFKKEENSIATPLIHKEGAQATISAGNTKINLSFLKNASLYDVLTKAKNNNKINFNGKNYPGLGFFVTDIGTLHSGSGKDLLYYINDKEASVGVSSYILKDGDVIEWKLE